MPSPLVFLFADTCCLILTRPTPPHPTASRLAGAVHQVLRLAAETAQGAVRGSHSGRGSLLGCGWRGSLQQCGGLAAPARQQLPAPGKWRRLRRFRADGRTAAGIWDQVSVVCFVCVLLLSVLTSRRHCGCSFHPPVCPGHGSRRL